MKKCLFLILTMLLTSCGDKDVSIDIDDKYFYGHYRIHTNPPNESIAFMLYADKIQRGSEKTVDVHWYFEKDQADNNSCYNEMNLIVNGKTLLPLKRKVELYKNQNISKIISKAQYDFYQGMEIIQAKHIKIAVCNNEYELTENNTNKLMGVFLEWLKFASK